MCFLIVCLLISQIFGNENLGDQIEEIPEGRIVGKAPGIEWRPFPVCRPENVVRRVAHKLGFEYLLPEIGVQTFFRQQWVLIFCIILRLRLFSSRIFCVLRRKRRIFALYLGMCETRGMNKVTRNIRYLLWKQGEERGSWEAKLSSWLGCTLERAIALLDGECKPLAAKEGELLSRLAGLKPGELSGDIPADQEVDILTENIRFLISTLPHGEKKKFAEKLGIDVTTVSRWTRGTQRPTKKKSKQISNYFGLPPDTDLEVEEVFLWTEPIGESQIKSWISERVAQLDGKTLREMYPALKRLFK